MSRENVAVVRRLFSALEENQFQEVLGLFDPEVEWSPAEGSFQGVDGVVAAFVEWTETWDEHRIDPEEFIEARGDRVLATIHLRGEHGGTQIDQRFFQLYTLREGKITRMIEFVDRAKALQAAGLPE